MPKTLRAACFPALLFTLVVCPGTEVSASVPQVRFEENRGQVSSPVRFLARGPGSTAYLTPSELVLAIAPSAEPAGAAAAVIRMRLLGASAAAEPRGVGRLAGVSNFYLGNDPARWRTGVPSYARVEISEVYPRIDFVLRGEPGCLEYDFVLAPGGDPGSIALEFGGACPEVTPEGGLLLHAGSSVVRNERPIAYQADAAGTRTPVDAHYLVDQEDLVHLEVGTYDPSLPLVVDPVLSYSTYLGGAGDDNLTAMAVDASGSAVLAGWTDSADFPTANAWKPVLTSWDGFVTRLDPSGTELVYSTFIGGTAGEILEGLALDAAGAVYVTGYTGSEDFPVRDAFQPVNAGGGDAFVLKLDPAGMLSYSTYLGGAVAGDLGSAQDWGSAIAVDDLGNAYVTGTTGAADFPTRNAYRDFHVWQTDGFVAKLDSTGSDLVYSTYLGGSRDDVPRAIDVGGDGSAYVTGGTDSFDFPLQDPFQAGCGAFDVFVTKFQPAGSALAYSTHLCSESFDEGFGIAVAADGSALVTGYAGAGFPLKDPYRLNASGIDAFLTKLDSAGTGLVFSTYLGGSRPDEARAIAVDAAGNAHVAGITWSQDFPTRDPVQATNAGGLYDAFVATFNAAGSDLVFSSYLGGSRTETTTAVAVDLANRIYVAGKTESTDFPLFGPFDAAYGGGMIDGFVARICLSPGLPLPPVDSTLTVVKVLPDGVRFHWTNVAGATSYNLYRDEAKDGAFAAPFGSAPDGMTGLERPQPAEPLVFFRVAAAAACAEGPK